MDTETLERRISDLTSALGDPTRRAIYVAVRESPEPVTTSQVAKLFGIHPNVARHHLDCHRIREMRPDTILKKLEAIDAFRRPDRFKQYLIACEADARGRKSMEDNPYPQADYFLNMFNIAKDIDTKPLIEKGFKGEAMAKELQQLRSKAISKIKDKYSE